MAAITKFAHAHWVVGKWETFQKGDVVTKWFSFTNHPMRMCGFCYATQWQPRPWKRSIVINWKRNSQSCGNLPFLTIHSIQIKYGKLNFVICADALLLGQPSYCIKTENIVLRELLIMAHNALRMHDARAGDCTVILVCKYFIMI
jgi:hypothetical protein